MIDLNLTEHEVGALRATEAFGNNKLATRERKRWGSAASARLAGDRSFEVHTALREVEDWMRAERWHNLANSIASCIEADIMDTVPNKPRTPISNFRIPAEVKAAAQARAEAEGKTLTDVVVEALAKYGRGKKR